MLDRQNHGRSRLEDGRKLCVLALLTLILLNKNFPFHFVLCPANCVVGRVNSEEEVEEKGEESMNTLCKIHAKFGSYERVGQGRRRKEALY